MVSKSHPDTPISFQSSSPWVSAPQLSHVKIFFAFPDDAGRRFPQSVQNINEPIAAMGPPFPFAMVRIDRLSTESRLEGVGAMIKESFFF